MHVILQADAPSSCSTPPHCGQSMPVGQNGQPPQPAGSTTSDRDLFENNETPRCERMGELDDEKGWLLRTRDGEGRTSAHLPGIDEKLILGADSSSHDNASGIARMPSGANRTLRSIRTTTESYIDSRSSVSSCPQTLSTHGDPHPHRGAACTWSSTESSTGHKASLDCSTTSCRAMDTPFLPDAAPAALHQMLDTPGGARALAAAARSLLVNNPILQHPGAPCHALLAQLAGLSSAHHRFTVEQRQRSLSQGTSAPELKSISTTPTCSAGENHTLSARPSPHGLSAEPLRRDVSSEAVEALLEFRGRCRSKRPLEPSSEEPDVD